MKIFVLLYSLLHLFLPITMPDSTGSISRSSTLIAQSEQQWELYSLDKAINLAGVSEPVYEYYYRGDVSFDHSSDFDNSHDLITSILYEAGFYKLKADKTPETLKSKSFNNSVTEWSIENNREECPKIYLMPAPGEISNVVEFRLKDFNTSTVINYIEFIQERLSPYIQNEVITLTVYGVIGNDDYNQTQQTQQTVEKFSEKLLTTLQATEVNRTVTPDSLNILANSPILNPGVLIGSEEINLNVAVRFGTDGVRVYMASPFLSMAY